MNENNLFQNHMSKLKLEAIVKSALCGGAVGFGVNFIVALVTWFTDFNGFWLSLGVLAAVSVAAGLTFYFLLFYPSDLRNARRVDGMGLQERMITMLEYQSDDSFMARVQREDARRALASVSKEKINLKISNIIIVIASVCFALGVSMTTVNGLSQYGVIAGGDDYFEAVVGDTFAEHHKIIYEVDEAGGGTLLDTDGELTDTCEQLVAEGKRGKPVTAVADDGYYFVKWSDGSTAATRIDDNVTDDAEYVAIFSEIGEEYKADDDILNVLISNWDGDEELLFTLVNKLEQNPAVLHELTVQYELWSEAVIDWMDDFTGDEAADAPKANQGQGNSGDASGDDPADNDSMGGGKYKPNNQIINGNIYYRQDIKNYQDDANNRILDESSNLTDDEIELIKKYLGIV